MHPLLDAGSPTARLGEPQLQARAAISNTRGWVASAAEVDVDRVRPVEVPLAAPGLDAHHRPLPRAMLAMELTYSNDYRRLRGHCDAAIADARADGDLDTLARVLISVSGALFVACVPDALEERLALTSEAVELATHTGDPMLQAWAWIWQRNAACQAGDLALFEEAIDNHRLWAERCGDLGARWLAMHTVCVRAMLEGDLATAESRPCVGGADLQLGRDRGAGDRVLLPWGGAGRRPDHGC